MVVYSVDGSAAQKALPMVVHLIVQKGDSMELRWVVQLARHLVSMSVDSWAAMKVAQKDSNSAVQMVHRMVHLSVDQMEAQTADTMVVSLADPWEPQMVVPWVLQRAEPKDHLKVLLRESQKACRWADQMAGLSAHRWGDASILSIYPMNDDAAVPDSCTSYHHLSKLPSNCNTCRSRWDSTTWTDREAP